MITLQIKTYKKIIQIGQKFLTIHAEYLQFEVLDLEKANAWLNLTNHEQDIDKICSYEKKTI